MTVSTLTVTPQRALEAYRQMGQTGGAGGSDEFGATLGRAMQNAIDLGHDADQQSESAITGGGDITHVVTAVSKAQLALQEVVAIRDKVVQAYQEVMRMSI